MPRRQDVHSDSVEPVRIDACATERLASMLSASLLVATAPRHIHRIEKPDRHLGDVRIVEQVANPVQLRQDRDDVRRVVVAAPDLAVGTSKATEGTVGAVGGPGESDPEGFKSCWVECRHEAISGDAAGVNPSSRRRKICRTIGGAYFFAPAFDVIVSIRRNDPSRSFIMSRFFSARSRRLSSVRSSML